MLTLRSESCHITTWSRNYNRNSYHFPPKHNSLFRRCEIRWCVNPTSYASILRTGSRAPLWITYRDTGGGPGSSPVIDRYVPSARQAGSPQSVDPMLEGNGTAGPVEIEALRHLMIAMLFPGRGSTSRFRRRIGTQQHSLYPGLDDCWPIRGEGGAGGRYRGALLEGNALRRGGRPRRSVRR